MQSYLSHENRKAEKGHAEVNIHCSLMVLEIGKKEDNKLSFLQLCPQPFIPSNGTSSNTTVIIATQADPFNLFNKTLLPLSEFSPDYFH